MFKPLTLEHAEDHPVGPFYSSKEVKRYLDSKGLYSPVFT